MRCTPLLLAIVCCVAACSHDDAPTPVAPLPGDVDRAAGGSQSPSTLAEGKSIFRFDTFGDETFWTDTLRMHEVIRTSVSPVTALSVGLKVDANALPPEVKAGIANKSIDLTSPATTVALLKLGAVVGVVGTVEGNTLTR